MNFVFNTVPRILCAQGSANCLADELRLLGADRPLLITDHGIVAAGVSDAAERALEAAGVQHSRFSEVEADPSEATVLRAVDYAIEQHCDAVIGFGGGSSMDVAKLVAVLLKQEQPLSTCYGVDQVSSTRAPLIQVPTTAGTGSEVTSVAIVTTGKTTKAGVVSKVLYADTVLLDAKLTVGLPAAVTAATGIDAMVHAIEAFTSKRLKNPMSDLLAQQALTLLTQNIERAVFHGGDLVARENMLLGAMLAGQAFSNAPVAAVHALAYPLGGIYHIPHGLSNSLVLPHVLRFNADSANTLYAQLLPSMGLEADSHHAAEAIANYAFDLAKNLGLASTLRELDIPEQELTTLAAQAMLQQRLLINNPREVNEADALAIYQNAF